MDEDIRRIDLDEFVARGYLQEVNRQFFHPRGLALEVEVDDDGYVSGFGGVWDYRDDPEGIVFVGDAAPDAEKAYQPEAELQAHIPARMNKFGWVIQPCDGG